MGEAETAIAVAANTDDKSKIPPSFRKPTVVRELALNTWMSVFEKAGEIENLGSENLSYDSIAKFLCKNQHVSNQFISALKAVYELGDNIGRNLIEKASIDVGLALKASDDESDRELAARIWLQSRTNKQYLDVLIRAQVNFAYSRKTKCIREYVGESSFSVDTLDGDKIKNIISMWCRENKKSEVVDTVVYKIDGVWCCNIVRGDPIKRVAIITENRQSELSYRPAACDHIRIDPETGRIGILTRSSSFIPIYRKVFGEILTGNPDYFSGENICTLKQLQKKGGQLFEKNLPHNILRVKTVELRWQRGGHDSIYIKGSDCFRILRDLDVQLKVGSLVEAKLDFYFAGSKKPSRVSIKVPNRIEIPGDEHELVITRYLDNVGIRGRFDDPINHLDFWSLNPWHLSESMWRQQIGEDFDTLRKAGCFNNIELETVKHPTGSGIMKVEHIFDKAVIGVSDEDHIGIRTLTPTDYNGYELNLSKIGAQISNSLALLGDVKEVNNGLWCLGYRSFTTVTIQVFFATSEPINNTTAIVNQCSNGYKPVLIIPDGCSYNDNLSIVYSQITSNDFDDLLQKIIESLQIQEHVDPPTYLPNYDLILDCAKNKTWYKGHEIKNLDAVTQPFRFAQKVAEAKGELVTKNSLNKFLSPSSTDEKVASKAKSDFTNKIKAAFEDLGETMPSEAKSIFLSKRGGYYLGCTAKVLY